MHAVNQIITMHVDVYRGSIQDTSIDGSDGWMSMQLRNQMGGRPAAGQSNKKASTTACACLRRQLIHGHLHLLVRSCLHVAAEAGIRPRQREAAAGRAKRTARASMSQQRQASGHDKERQQPAARSEPRGEGRYARLESA
jgi:hypothetical protein